MNQIVRRLLGVVCISAGWGAVWTAVFAGLVAGVGFLRPQDLDSGEGVVPAAGIGLLVGCVSGTFFGGLLAFAENQRQLRDLSLLRMAIWGMIAAAVWPLVTEVDNRMVFILCPLGAAWACVSVGAGRSVGAAKQRPLARWIGSVLAFPLQAACGANR